MANRLFGKLVPAGNISVSTGQQHHYNTSGVRRSWSKRAVALLKKFDRSAQDYLAAMAEARSRR